MEDSERRGEESKKSQRSSIEQLFSAGWNFNRGGASGATFTNHVAGNRAISDMVVYSSYITYVNTRACANSAELAIFEIIFYREKEL